MKTITLKLALAALLPALTASCMTTYDARGNPVQSVDPAAAAAIGAGAAVLGYAAGRNSRRDAYYGPYYGPYYRPPHHHPRPCW